MPIPTPHSAFEGLHPSLMYFALSGLGCPISPKYPWVRDSAHKIALKIFFEKCNILAEWTTNILFRILSPS
jgi:hypothetical protein